MVPLRSEYTPSFLPEAVKPGPPPVHTYASKKDTQEDTQGTPGTQDTQQQAPVRSRSQPPPSIARQRVQLTPLAPAPGADAPSTTGAGAED